MGEGITAYSLRITSLESYNDFEVHGNSLAFQFSTSHVA